MMTNGIKKILILIIIAIASNYGQQIKKNKYGLIVVDNISTYREMAAKDSNNELVNLQKIIPNVKLDIRYATKNNFLGEPVYNSAYAFLRLPAALSLKESAGRAKDFRVRNKSV